ncbi:hypothetical protein [Actinotignum urinale]|uniref:RING-type E3 ubiquitin transferase n=1 Tax=Actinotignum urinale TaxID=190146 RepID=A0AAW9HY27_9ACTO|nr:hypothetical protein [Actinotignum urinale]MDY5155145.1 hypothetical protein [Actinotignum urinale]
MAKAKTRVVTEIWDKGRVPADRPIDRARRLGVATLWGLAIGGGVGPIILPWSFWGAKGIALLVFATIVGIGAMSPWLRKEERNQAPGVEVVARVLGTDEDSVSRTLKRGRKSVVMLPVVARPVDGGEDFRTVIAVHGAEQAGFQEEHPGALLPLWQVEKGYAEIENVSEVSQAQKELMDFLYKRPKAMKNSAQVLPFKPRVLELVTPKQRKEWITTIIGVAVGVVGVCALIGFIF